MLILSKNGKILSKIHEIVSLGNISLNSSSDRFLKSITPKKLIIFALLVLFLGDISILFFTNFNNSLSNKQNNFIAIAKTRLKIILQPLNSFVKFSFTSKSFQYLHFWNCFHVECRIFFISYFKLLYMKFNILSHARENESKILV